MLDLFSGIGGFSLGLERTGGFQTVAFVENNSFCQRVLRKHWPGVPIYEDIYRFWAAKGSAEVVVGGFPCQPFSSASAGKRYGEAHDEYLWPQMHRVIDQCRPRWVVAENVTHLDGMALDAVVSDLEASDYEVQTLEIPACAVGHDHRRSRLWILGHTYRDGKSGLRFNDEVARMQISGSLARIVGTDDGLPARMDRLRALGNAVVPQIPELIGRAILSTIANT